MFKYIYFILAVILSVVFFPTTVCASVDEWVESWEGSGTDGDQLHLWEGYGNPWQDNNAFGLFTRHKESSPSPVPDGDWVLGFPTTGPRMGSRSIGTPTDPFEVSFMYNGEGTDHDGSGYYKHSSVMLGSGTGDWPFAGGAILYTNMANNDKVSVTFYGESSIVATASENTWFEVKMLIDPTVGTYDAYLGGQLVGTVDLISGQAVTHITLQREGDDSAPTYYHDGYLDKLAVARIKPAECGDSGTEYTLGDITGPNGVQDCYVNLLDMAALAADWMLCADMNNPECDAFDNAYVLHWGGPAEPFPLAGAIELTMGNDEYESVELGVKALRNLGSISLSVQSTPTLPAGALVLGTQNGISNSSESYGSTNYGISYDPNALDVTLQMLADDEKSFWLSLNSNYLSAGDYVLSIEIAPKIGPAEYVPILLHVLDVQRAPFSEASINMYHTLTNLYPYTPDSDSLLAQYYVHQAMVHFPYAYWENELEVTRDGLGDLQVSDWTTFDAKLQQALDDGLDEIALMGEHYNETWFSVLDPCETPTEQKESRREFGGLLVDHLLGSGFHGPDTNDPNRVWIYAFDELSYTDQVSQETLDQLTWLNSMHPAVKTHMTFNWYSAANMNTLNPYLDVYTPALRACETMVDDINDATVTIDANDQLGFYAQGRYNYSPDDMRRIGWLGGFLGVKYFTIFAYDQSYEERMVVDGPGGDGGKNIPTPALEGLRDGFEEYGYWQKLAMVLEEAESLDPGSLTPAQQQALADAQAFKDAVFSTDPGALVKMVLVPPEGTGQYGERAWHDVENPDRWVFLSVKVQLLGHIAAIEDILGS